MSVPLSSCTLYETQPGTCKQKPKHLGLRITARTHTHTHTRDTHTRNGMECESNWHGHYLNILNNRQKSPHSAGDFFLNRIKVSLWTLRLLRVTNGNEL